MICPHCGSSISDVARFCSECGRSVQPATPDAANGTKADTGAPEHGFPAFMPAPTMPQSFLPAQQETQETPKKPVKGRRPRKKTVLLLVAALLVAILAVAIPVGIHSAHQKTYDEGAALLAAGDYEAAAACFASLEDFEDAAEQRMVALQHQAYDQAAAQREDGAYLEAKAAFLALGDFLDAADCAAECQNAYDYEAADALLAAENFAGAKTAFESLGGYRDSAKRAKDCGQTLDYAAAEELFFAKDYAAAADYYKTLSQESYLDSAEKLVLCNNWMAYIDADTFYNQGLYYSAYLGFRALSGFEDAASRAQGCAQPLPAGGDYDYNDSFGKRSIALRFNNKASDYPHLYKIYAQNDTYVCTVIVPAGKMVSVKLPAGFYYIKEATGVKWYGFTELFGDEDADYSLMLVSGSDSVFELEKGYYYTITVNADEGNIGSRSVNRSDF